MTKSTKEMAREYLGVDNDLSIRMDLFEHLGHTGEVISLRNQLSYLEPFRLPLKKIAPHPRLAPIPAIHFDHYNSSVTNLEMPDASGRFDDGELRSYGWPTGTCLNFMQDHDGNTYGFAGNIAELFNGEGEGPVDIAFKLALFNEDFAKVDEFKVVEFSIVRLFTGDLPMNLGYFVMDEQGRVIVVSNGTEILFIKKDSRNRLRVNQAWDVRAELLDKGLSPLAVENGLAQVIPTFDQGYWAMALGKAEETEVISAAFLALLDDHGRVQSVHEFENEVIENGLAVDQSGAYIVTDRAMYKFSYDSFGRLRQEWRQGYERTSSVEKIKDGVISKFGSGSTPTLFGKNDDLVAITDNADDRVNLLVYHRQSGERLYRIPLFEPGKSANENTVVAYRDSVVVQNWYGSPGFQGNMVGLEPGLMRFDLYPDREGYRPDRSTYALRWWNKNFATTATARLSTYTGLIYGTIQQDTRLDSVNEKYAMVYIDFETGEQVKEVYLGWGWKHRISMAPSYMLPGGILIQPVRRGMVVIRPR